MKTCLILILLVSASITAYAQNYLVHETMDIIQCDREGNPLTETSDKLQIGIKFIVERQKGDILIISIPEFTGKGKKVNALNEMYVGVTQAYEAAYKASVRESYELAKSLRYEPDTLASDSLDEVYLEKLFSKVSKKYFRLTVSDLSKKATLLISDVSTAGGFVFGPLIVPIKVRFGTKNTNFELTSDVNLGLAAGHKFAFLTKRNKPWEFALVGGLSITSISMDANTTDNFLTQENKIAALTSTISGVFIKDAFQIGLMIGMDTPSGEVGKKWIYRDIPWIGFGLGVTLFNNNNKETKPVAISN